MGDGRAAPDLVTVVMPVRNGARYLAEQLGALARQTYRGRWELVVVDNGSTDRTRAIVDEWRARLPALRIVAGSKRKGLNRTRNLGAAAGRGELLAFCDADDLVDRGWLAGLVEAAQHHDLVVGAAERARLNNGTALEWRPPPVPLSTKHEFLPHASGGNCAVWADVARAVRWDESFLFGSSDIEFSWRVQLAGYSLGHAPDAVLHVRYRNTLSGHARKFFVYGMSDVQLYRRFRRHGMRRRTVREAAREWRGLVVTVSDLRRDPTRGDWVRRSARSLGRAAGSIRWRVLFP